MFPFLPTIILRHRKENLKKCSLRGLEYSADLRFYTYPLQTLPSLEGYLTLYLSPDTTQELSPEDAGCGLFLLDSTWHYEGIMHQAVKKQHPLTYRSLPSGFSTAYPRKQTECIEPDKGLATLEALYIAYTILGREGTHLLQYYHWKKLFLEKNALAFSRIKSLSL